MPEQCLNTLQQVVKIEDEVVIPVTPPSQVVDEVRLRVVLHKLYRLKRAWAAQLGVTSKSITLASVTIRVTLGQYQACYTFNIRVSSISNN